MTVSRRAAKERFYDTIADRFDEVVNRYDLGRRIEIVFDEMLAGEPLAGRRLLDVGCGTGLVGAYLVSHGYSAIDGLDFSAEMLSQARSKQVYQTLIQGDLNTVLDISDQTYDAGISCGTFTHGHVEADALDEILRVLKPGGYFACTIHREVWQTAGFENKFAELMASGVADLERMNEQAFYKNAPNDGCFCLIRRL